MIQGILLLGAGILTLIMLLVTLTVSGPELCVPVWALFMLIGSLLFAYYTISTEALPADTRAYAVFPYFILTEMPVGVTGLIFAGLIAAAFSSLDSDLNSLSAVAVEDYYKRMRKGVNDKEALWFSRVMVVVFGAVSIGIAMYLTSTPLVPGSKPVLDLGNDNYTHHSYMLGVYTHVILFVVGYVASLFFKAEPPPANLTIHAWLAKRRAGS